MILQSLRMALALRIMMAAVTASLLMHPNTGAAKTTAMRLEHAIVTYNHKSLERQLASGANATDASMRLGERRSW